MMDTSLYSEQFHPLRPDKSQDYTKDVSARFSRTQRPPKYYIIDYGLARRYDASENPPMEQTDIFGSDFTVPEFNALDKPHNPFPIDIYCLGNVIRNEVLGVRPDTCDLAPHSRNYPCREKRKSSDLRGSFRCSEI